MANLNSWDGLLWVEIEEEDVVVVGVVRYGG